jgi:hypothetical protein
LYIYGSNFGRNASQNSVTIGGITVPVASVGIAGEYATMLQVTIPKNMNCNGYVTVNVGGLTASSGSYFTYSPTYTVSTLAGTNVLGYVQGSGGNARFNSPRGIASDGTNLYVADYGNRAVRMVTLSGTVSEYCNVTNGISNHFDGPWGIVRYNSAVYVADENKSLIKRSTGGSNMNDWSGSNNNHGYVNGTTSTRYNRPKGIYVSNFYDLFIADTNNHAIRRLGNFSNSANMTSYTQAGNGSPGFVNGIGSAAQFNTPYDVTEHMGDIYVADRGNHAIRKMTSNGIVTTLAGNGSPGYSDGTGSGASCDSPQAICSDMTGNFYVADYQSDLLRKVTSSGVVTTVAGGYGYVNGTGMNARFNSIAGMVVVNGIIYVADTGNHCIRKIVIE